MARMIDSAGELNRRIRIMQITSTQDAWGAPEDVATEVCKCWAAVRDASYRANESFSAAAGRTVEVVNFIIRHVAVERYGVRPGMYVDYDNKRHKIIGLYNGEHGRDFVTLNTEQVQEVSG